MGKGIEAIFTLVGGIRGGMCVCVCACVCVCVCVCVCWDWLPNLPTGKMPIIHYMLLNGKQCLTPYGDLRDLIDSPCIARDRYDLGSAQ